MVKLPHLMFVNDGRHTAAKAFSSLTALTRYFVGHPLLLIDYDIRDHELKKTESGNEYWTLTLIKKKGVV